MQLLLHCFRVFWMILYWCFWTGTVSCVLRPVLNLGLVGLQKLKDWDSFVCFTSDIEPVFSGVTET